MVRTSSRRPSRSGLADETIGIGDRVTGRA